MNMDPIWDNTIIAEKISKKIESIRLIPNRVKKRPPFEAHFCRPKNTELSNLLTNPNTNSLTYNNIKSFYLDKRLLQNPTLTPAAKWDRDTNSEVNLDIQYKPEDTARRDPPFEKSKTSDSSNSDNAPLKPTQKGTIIPSKFKFPIGNKTTIIDQTRRNLARKTIRRINPEPRETLKPLWSIIPDGTIVDYTPHTITIDTHNRKNTVIRNSDIAISSEKRRLPLEPKPQEPKLRLINFVACKTVGESNRNKRKIEKFCLAEKAQTAKTSRTEQPTKNAGKEAPSEPQPISETRSRNTTMDAPWPSSASHEQGTSTSIDEDDNTSPVTLNISPIVTKAHPSPAQRKSKKKSPKLTQLGKRSSIRKKAAVSAARKTTNMKLPKAKLVAFKQSYVFNLSQSSINMDELGKKKVHRTFSRALQTLNYCGIPLSGGLHDFNSHKEHSLHNR